MKKYFAEFLGTAFLVLIGCGCAAIYGGTSNPVLVAFAFGFALCVGCYVFGGVSGCHVNPAVSLAMLILGKINVKDFICYVVAQVAGAFAGSGILYFLFTQVPNIDIASIGLGANGFDSASAVSISMTGAIIIEVLLTMIFVLCVIGTTSKTENGAITGLSLGFALTVVHFLGIPFTGTSVNPARSLAPAVLTGGDALSQVWVFIVAPLVGAALAAGIWMFLTSKNEVTEEVIEEVIVEDISE